MIRPLLWLPILALSGPAVLAQDASLEKRAIKLHTLAGGDWCEPLEYAYDAEDAYRSWTFTYQPAWSADAEPEEVTLIRIWCMAGAYNVTHAYYLMRPNEGLTPHAFATPSFEASYENDDSLEGDLTGIEVTGINATHLLTNSEFDPEAKVITSHALWRGVGDASSSGTWFFDDGEFSLVLFEIDASYDGEVNPEKVVDYLAAQGG